MQENISIGILRETKTPPDRRTLFAPKTALEFTKLYPNIELVIQSSELRCFNDKEYSDLGLVVQDDISHCDVLLGVKEVKIEELLPNKQYHFFSHTHKKQSYNRELLQTLVALNIKMVDHECLTYENGARVVAFGRWAGIVGTYNGLIAVGKRNQSFNIKRANECLDMGEMLKEVKNVKLDKNYKILITGKGRVGMGAMETLKPLNLKEVNANDFLNKEFDEPVVCQIDAEDYVSLEDSTWKNYPHFFENPEQYVSTFKRYSKVADLWIPCHFWNNNSPKFLLPEDYRENDFKIQIIADVSCDIADPIPSTLRPSTIADPFYGYNPKTGKEDNAFDKYNITIMAVDNCPGELPRDASEDFGNTFLQEIIPDIIDKDSKGIVKRATICCCEDLTSYFAYLQDFLDGVE